MATEVDRLLVIYDVNDSDFILSMRRMQQQSEVTNGAIVRQAAKAETAAAAMSSSWVKAGVAVTAAIAAIGMATSRFTDPYRAVRNQLRAIGQESAGAADKLYAAASRSMAQATNFATTVSRIQKATGAGYDTTIRRVETLQKLMQIGGLDAATADGVVTQLSQALQSGVLQGDEFRSLREGAPVELMDAIAKAAGTTRDKLREFSADGKLTSDIVLEAIDSMAQGADRSFANLSVSTAGAMTQIWNSLQLVVGAFDEGAGASDGLNTGLRNLATSLASFREGAQGIGEEVSAWGAAFWALVEAFGGIVQYLPPIMSLGKAVSLIGDAFDLVGGAVSSSSALFEDFFRGALEGLKTLVGSLTGAVSVIANSVNAMIDLVSGGLSSIANQVLEGIEYWINSLLDGVRMLASAVDAITAKLPGYEGTNLAGGVGSVSLGRLSGGTNLASGSIEDSWNSGKAAGEAAVDGAVDSVAGFFQGVKDAYDKRRTEIDQEKQDQVARRKDADISPTSPDGSNTKTTTTTTTGDDKKKGGRGGRGRRQVTAEDILADTEAETAALVAQREALGLSTEAAAALIAKKRMLIEMEQRGIPITDAVRKQVEETANAYGAQVAALEAAQTTQQAFDSAVENLAGGLASVITEGQNLGDVLGNVFKQLANDLITSGLTTLLKNLFSSTAGAGGGGAFGFLSAIFGGARANGGSVMAGNAYVVGEKRPELFVPSVNGTIIPSTDVVNAASSGKGSKTQVQVIPSKLFDVVVKDIADQSSAKASAAVVKALPDQIKSYETNRRKR